MKDARLNTLVRQLIDESTPMEPIPTGVETRASKPEGIKAVLFDVYGTLLVCGAGDVGTSLPDLQASDMDALFRHCGMANPFGPSENIAAALKKCIIDHHEIDRRNGLDYPEVDIREIWSEVLADSVSGGRTMEGHIAEEFALRYEMAVNPVWPMPNFPDIVEKLSESGLRVGIVSNAQFYTPLLLEGFAGRTLTDIGFESRLCAWSYVEGLAKPSARLFTGPLKALDGMGISPPEVLYVGNDMLNDVQTAANWNCQTCLFAGDRRSLRLREGDKRVQAEADIIVRELSWLECLV